MNRRTPTASVFYNTGVGRRSEACGEGGLSTLSAYKLYNGSNGRKRYCGGNCSKPLMVVFKLFQRPSLMP